MAGHGYSAVSCPLVARVVHTMGTPNADTLFQFFEPLPIVGLSFAAGARGLPSTCSGADMCSKALYLFAPAHVRCCAVDHPDGKAFLLLLFRESS